MVQNEYLMDNELKALPVAPDEPAIYYWWILRPCRKSKRHPDGWKVARQFAGTKATAAKIFCDHYRDGQHKLRCLMKY
jgi:hypothetical protein